MLDLFRTIAAYLLFAFAVLIIVMNWACVILGIRNRIKGIPKSYSLVPLVSLILIFLMMVVYPNKVGWPFRVTPLLDPGTWWVLIAPFWLLLRWWNERTKS